MGTTPLPTITPNEAQGPLRVPAEGLYGLAPAWARGGVDPSLPARAMLLGWCLAFASCLYMFFVFRDQKLILLRPFRHKFGPGRPKSLVGSRKV